ncbi:hypothetical protein BKH45_00335 [Helicobacter sp. 11S03491-1]|nr:hypothetical protein BKH45_00335 [Helicobacter sp. 11S03491-1]
MLYIGIAHHAMGENVGFQEILQVLIDGSKYDNRAVAGIGIIYFLLGFVLILSRFQKHILSFYARFIFVICIFLGIANMVFYSIYNDSFNGNLLGIIFDDQKAIFKTGLSGDYYITLKIIFLILASLFCFYLYSKMITFFDWLIAKKAIFGYTKTANLCLFIIFAGLITTLINSHFGFKGISLDQHIQPAQDSFLRKITPGAFRDIYLVYRDYKKIANSHFSDFYQKSPLQSAKEFFNLPEDTKPPLNLYQLLSHTSTNTSHTQIKHIFYIVSESLSEYSFDPLFDSIDLSSGLKSLIDNQHGFKMQNFLQNAPMTIKSLDVQITGLFQTDIPLNTMLGHLPLFPTAIGGILKQLDYDTRFYYGGSGVWQKLDRYTAQEGFNQILYNTNILNYAKNKPYPKPYENLWGVYDNILFDYIKQNTLEATKPTFNMIMTTSYHPPYDVNLKYFNVPLDKIQKFLDTHFPNSSVNANILGHMWWYDKQVTRFVQEVSKACPQSLFIITGDHFDRMYPSAHRDNRITNSIPLILYSPVLTPKQLANIGSHIDIAPTIVELVSPKGFKYAGFGKPLFSNNHALKFDNNRYALGYFAVATHRFIATPQEGIEYINDSKPQEHDDQEVKKLYDKLNQARALSWWLFMKGNIIYDDK